MNFFFGIKNNVFQSRLTIPKFQNKNIKSLKIKLYKCFPSNNKWVYEELTNNNLSEDFFRIENNEINNNELYFLAYSEDLRDFNENTLNDYNSITDTTPSYRANFEIFFPNPNKKGFSSYQSEYPFRMIKIQNSIVSSVNLLTNKNAEKNYVLIRNIFEKPIHEKFEAYIVDVEQKEF